VPADSGANVWLRHCATALRHPITAHLQRTRALSLQGVTMEDSMVADAVLWALFATAIAFIWWGCHNTKPMPNTGIEPDHSFTHAELDRAA